MVQDQLHEALRTGCDCIVRRVGLACELQDNQARGDMRSPHMNVHVGAGPYSARARKYGHSSIEPRCRKHDRRRDDPVAATDFVASDTGEIERATLADRRSLTRTVLRMDASHAYFTSGRHDNHRVADPHLARVDGASDDRADALQSEGAVDCKAEMSIVH